MVVIWVIILILVQGPRGVPGRKGAAGKPGDAGKKREERRRGRNGY